MESSTSTGGQSPHPHYDREVERFHQTLRSELLDQAGAFTAPAAARAAIDAWVGSRCRGFRRSRR